MSTAPVDKLPLAFLSYRSDKKADVFQVDPNGFTSDDYHVLLKQAPSSHLLIAETLRSRAPTQCSLRMGKTPNLAVVWLTFSKSLIGMFENIAKQYGANVGSYSGETSSLPEQGQGQAILLGAPSNLLPLIGRCEIYSPEEFQEKLAQIRAKENIPH